MKKKIIIIPCSIVLGLVLLVIGAYFYMSAGQPAKDGRADWVTQYLVAHRGLFHDEIPENTLGAFEEAVNKGYAIELDVMLSNDGKIMVFHDSNLERMTGDTRELEEVDYAELRDLKVGGTDYQIPTLREVLDLVDGQVPIMIELKNSSKVMELGKLVYEEVKDYDGDFSILSFQPFILKWYKENAPEIVRGQLSGGVSEEESLKWYERLVLTNFMVNFISKPQYIAHAVEELDHFRIPSLRASGIPVITWTITEEAMFESTLEKSDSIIFDSVPSMYE